MGSRAPQQYDEEEFIPPTCKLYSKMTLTSTNEEEYIREIISRRGSLFANQHICTVAGYQFLLKHHDRITCEDSRELLIFYESFDYLLCDIPIHEYTFTQSEICSFLESMCDALVYLRQHNYRHGDISLGNVCRKGNLWKLVDKTFLRNGVTAYERILEGEKGFISPEQMERIRYGFVRESLPITEADDVFALGMVAMQLATKLPSMPCYKDSFIRFNDDVIQERFSILRQRYTVSFANLIQRMLHPESQSRISLNQLCSHPLIHKTNKFSLKQRSESLALKQSAMKPPNSVISQTTQQASIASSTPKHPSTFLYHP